ncbi:hypothetical protein GIB67_041874 [Kingdonia uniflora]|uniref:TF-B3 domain-containing protein n=1 Tax=Kingdonia uniflora TaxID=39325 RepID=A0A7J7L5T3_9MAGN|nr:hypothetical protein GIB67_041874 [Kingdonia uniflora]
MAGVNHNQTIVFLEGDNHRINNNNNNEEDEPALLVGGSRIGGAGRRLVAAGFRGLASFGTNRGRRMARQRRASMTSLPFPSAGSSSNLQRVPESPVVPPVAPVSRPAQHSRDVDARKLRFLLQKELRHSDRAAELNLPTLESKEGFFIGMEDMDGMRVWSFKYRFWPNNNSRMYILENTGEFVRSHGLEIGDYMMLYKDDQNNKYIIRARKASDQTPFYDYRRNGFYDGNMHFFPDVDGNRANMFQGMDDISTSFYYDTTTNFPDDFPVDFPSLEPVRGFGSVEGLSLDDFP